MCRCRSRCPASDVAIAQDVTINGLPITSGEDPHLDDWYRANVVGGVGSFVVVADGFAAFAEAFQRKCCSKSRATGHRVARKECSYCSVEGTVQGKRMVRRLNIDGDGQGDLVGTGASIAPVLAKMYLALELGDG